MQKLYIAYSIAVVIGSPFIPYLLDKIGNTFGAILLNFALTLSSLLMYFGMKYQAFSLLLVARFIAGLAAENLIVAQNSLAEKWFTGKFAGVAIGLNGEMYLIG